MSTRSTGICGRNRKSSTIRRYCGPPCSNSGFDADRFAELVQDADVKARLLDNTERSVARGTFGSPTFFVDDEIFFGKDRLRDVEEMIVASR